MSNEKTLYRTTQMIWYVFYILESLLLLRFVLKLLGANPGAGFTQFIYGITAVPVAPFQFVFPAGAVAGSVMEWSTLLALIVYFFLAKAVVKLLSMGRDVTESEADMNLRMQDTE